MAYIGNPPITGNFQVCDAISVVNGQAAYTMQVSSANVTPESANHMLVSLNGVLQKPNSSFTISGSTITFASNLATGDVIDFIILLGNVLDLGVPSDATVTNAKTNFTSTSSAAGLQIKGDGTTDGTLQLNCSQNSHGVKLKSPAHSAGQSYTLTLPATAPATDKIIQTNSSGVLSFVDKPSGAHALLSTTTVSSSLSQVDISSNIDSTYKIYMIDVINLHCSDDGVSLYLRFFQGGSVNTSGVYDFAYSRQKSTTTSAYVARNQNTTFIQVSTDLDSQDTSALSGRFFLYDPSETTFNKNITFHTSQQENGDYHMGSTGSGRIESTSAVDGIRFYCSGGTIDSGIFKLYGVS